MHIERAKAAAPLQSEQWWRTEHGYLYIVELGDRVIHYKMIRRPDQRTVATRLMRLEALVNYLRQTEAELVPEGLAMELGAVESAA